MNVLDLFSGGGGGILAAKMLGHRIVCSVEIDSYCRRVLVQRQNEGLLEPFPIWNDVTTFDGRHWRGIVDIVQGGFPCQDLSTANNKAEGLKGKRSGLWFEMLRIVREVRPGFVFVENVPTLVSRGLDTVLGGLAEIGYDAEWLMLGADDVGAPHVRKRMWILGRNADLSNLETVTKIPGRADAEYRGVRGDGSDPNGFRKQQSKRRVENERRRTGDVGNEMANTESTGREARSEPKRSAKAVAESPSMVKMFPTVTAQDAKNNCAQSQLKRNTPPLNAVVEGSLNPEWVELLMGWPCGWTSLEAGAVTGRKTCREPQRT